MVGWDEVLERILREEPRSQEYDRSDIILDVPLTPSDTEPVLGDVETDILATYHPSRSPPTITYDINKIVYHSDMILYNTMRRIGKIPSLKLIRLFRFCFASFVRRHEMFHYLVERGSRLLSGLNYDDYSEKVCKARANSKQGNLEEALADAYASVRYYWLEEIYYTYSFRYLIYEYIPKSFTIPPELIDDFTKILKHHFINSKRPPGYDKAKLFVNEFKHLLLRYRYRYIPYHPFLRNYPINIFKGLSWLFYELSVREPRDFSDYNHPPADPYSHIDFVIFLENIRYDDDPLLGTILPFPEERPK